MARKEGHLFQVTGKAAAMNLSGDADRAKEIFIEMIKSIFNKTEADFYDFEKLHSVATGLKCRRK